MVGDSKTDDLAWSNFEDRSIHYLSLSHQRSLFPEFSELLGSRTYARKNIGYLYAAKNGAEEIFDTDDDTFLRAEAQEFFSNLSEIRYFIASQGDYFNPYSFFQPSSGLWPRGYPLRKVATDRFQINSEHNLEETKEILKFDILQTLVNLEPDVDSIYRMTVGDKTLDFPVTNEIVFISKPLVTPANTQSTFWKSRDKFEYLYVPRWVSFRFSDILKMYVAQHFATIAYAGFWTEQVRNPHDYMVDFESEVDCFVNTEKVVKMLHGEQFESLTTIYSALVDLGVCTRDEIVLASMFSELMRSVINE